MVTIGLINIASEDVEPLRRMCPPEANLLAAKNPQEVFSLMSQNHIDAYVIDLQSSNIQLRDIIRYINSQDSKCPIFAYTGECDPKVLLLAGQLGVLAYFKKPEEKRKLAKAIANLLKATPHITSHPAPGNWRYGCPQCIRLAMDYALKNFVRMKRASELSEILEVSYSHFSCKFKRWTGYSFWDYIILLKIEEAKRLLEDTTLCVKEIAYKVGFNNYPHFLKMFKHHEGMSPTFYRKNFKHRATRPSNVGEFTQLPRFQRDKHSIKLLAKKF